MADPTDFDFIIGSWRVAHRRLVSRLTSCTEWTEFSGTTSTRKILGGAGNVEDNVFHLPDGDLTAAALRSFDPAAGTWSIWWLDSRWPHRLDPPVVGGFAGELGTFTCDDTLNGVPIKVRFFWRKNPGGHPTWEQAFSSDGGASWETNWTMQFVRIDRELMPR